MPHHGPRFPGKLVTGARRAALWLMLVLLAGETAMADDATRAQEYQVKAAFLYNFTKFVEWPAERFAGPDAAFVIGVLGPEQMARDLEHTVRGRKVNGRAIEVRMLHRSAEAAEVHMVFDGRAGEGESREQWQHPGTLLVVDSERVLRRRGAIAFVFVEDKLRFAIDIEAAARVKLKISAQLQKLAVSVRKAP